jgi:hypothetical protein
LIPEDVRWRTAAIVWAVAIAGVGIGIAAYGGPDDGTHHDYCARGMPVSPVTARVSLTALYPGTAMHLRLGTSFLVTVDGGASPVVTPVVTHRGVVCQATRAAPATQLAVTFTAIHPGTTTLLSFYDQAGSSGGIAQRTFSATLTVAR